MATSELLQAVPVFTFANQAGLDMLETTLVALQDISLEKIFDDHGRKNLCSEIPQIMHQVSQYEAIASFIPLLSIDFRTIYPFTLLKLLI